MSLEMGAAAGLRIRTPGLDRPGFAQSVLDSMRDDALTMAQNQESDRGKLAIAGKIRASTAEPCQCRKDVGQGKQNGDSHGFAARH